MVNVKLNRALTRRYETMKTNYPNEGRRRWILHVLYDSWPEILSDDVEMLESDGSSMPPSDPDGFDRFVEDEGLGLIIRTDFADDDAWSRFRRKVRVSQDEFISELKDEPQDADGVEDGDSDSSEELVDILNVVDPPEQLDRLRITGISNLAALRLFNDVDIRRAPPRPTRFNPSHQSPLVDQGGWQEIYSGKQLWIYDSRSNSDECVRVVGQAGDFHGTATGDSWRARASHICELQFNMTHQGMKIDFDGLDRWDPIERARNLAEAVLSR